MQPDEDKKNLFDVSLTDNIKISFEQSSCPYENYACKIRDELLKQIEEDIQKIDEIKDEPCHSSEEVGDDVDAGVEGGVPSMTGADTGSGSGSGVIDHEQKCDAKVRVPGYLLDHCYCMLPLMDECRLSLEDIKQENIDASSQDYPTQTIEDVIKQENIDASSHNHPTQAIEDVIKQENIDASSQDYPTQAIEDVEDVLTEDITVLMSSSDASQVSTVALEDSKVTCNNCSRTFGTSRGLNIHSSKVHKRVRSGSTTKEPHHPEHVSGDSDTRVGDDVASITSADTRAEHVRIVARAVAGAICRKRGIAATLTRAPVDRAAGASCRSNEEDHPAIKMARESTSRSGGAPQQPSTVRSKDPKGAVPEMRKPSQKQRVEAVIHTPSGSVSASGEKDLQRSPGGLRLGRIGDDCLSLRSVRREYSAHSSLLPSASVTEANVSTSMDIASVRTPTVPSASDTRANVPVGSSVAEDVRPSFSGLAGILESLSNMVPRNKIQQSFPREEEYELSEMDSDYDDACDEPVQIDPARNIPDDEEIEEPIRETIRALEREMDNEIERLVGTSSSYEWVEGFDTFRGRREEFTGPAPGPVGDYDTPYDAFTEIWSNDIIQRIVLETNRYAKQTIDSKTAKGELASQSRLRKWSDADVDDIYRLFAMYIYMGICQRKRRFEYWWTDTLEMSKFRNVMSYDRYVLLDRFLHFVDNSDASPTLRQDDGLLRSRKVSKLAPVIIHLNSKFSSLYHLSRDISINESLTLYKGRLSWAQAIRSKATRFGMKSFELCESNSGYLYKFQIYSGKNSESMDTAAVSSDLAAKSTKVVLDLLKGLEHRGHRLTMDNFYNCPALSRYLKSLGFDSLGTLRVSRKNVPNAIAKVPANVAQGTIVARHCGDVSIVAWKDPKVMTLISTYHTNETYAGTRAGNVLVKPVCARDYIRTMGGVDNNNQHLSNYLVERKRGLKWFMMMFRRLVNVSIDNAYSLYTASRVRRNMTYMTRRDFRYVLADSLVERHSHQRLIEISQPIADCTRLNRNIVHVPEIKIGEENRWLCVICYRKGIKKRVYSRCIPCESYLCFEGCWLEWHSLAVLQ